MDRLRACSILVLAIGLSTDGACATPPNVLLICVDDLRPELKCFGKDYIHSPNIDQLASRGRAFHHHYVQAPTCGASRYTLLTGTYGPGNNDALFARAKRADQLPSMPEWFRRNGYTTVSVGKVSHHPGGRGGPNWDEDGQPEMPDAWDRHRMPVGPWQHPRGAMHGLANGEIRHDAGDMDLFQSVDGDDSIYPDGLISDEAISQLDALAADQNKPFFLAVGIIRPHLPFGAPAKYAEPYQDVELPLIPHPQKPPGKTTWHRSGEFMNYNRWGRDPNLDPEFADQVRRHYAACVTYADAMVGKVIDRLDELKIRDNTIVILWGDHGWHLGEYSVWGKHTLFEESLRSPLIVSYPGIPAPGEATDSMVETLDIFPTLCDLSGLPTPEFADGATLRPILESPTAPGHDAVSYANAETIRTEQHRLIVHRDGAVELYDYDGDETKNIAAQNQIIVAGLKSKLIARIGNRTDH